MWTTENITSQSGKTIIVTGANTGIGYETALALYKVGAHVILACRSLKNAEDAIAKIKQTEGSGSLEAAVLDLSSLASVKQFAENFKQNHQQLNVLINNAGVMIPPASITIEGYELQFGVNFLGHFALTGCLYPLLKATANSRVVTVSSMAYLRGNIDFDNLKSEISYDPTREYAQSKLANILFTLELQHRIEKLGDHLMSIAAQPGANNTELARNMPKDDYNAAVKHFDGLMEPWQGALPSLYAAVEPTAEAGALYGPHIGGYKGYPVKDTIAEHALDETLAEKLWKFAEDATGVVYSF